MNRSSSEWFLQTFLHEASAVTEFPVTDATASSAVPSITTKSSTRPELIDSDVEMKGKPSLLSDPTPPVLQDTEEYQAFLKRTRNLTCSAVVSSRASADKPQDSAPSNDHQLQGPNSLQLGAQSFGRGTLHAFPEVQDKVDNGPVGIRSLPAIQKNPGVQIKPTTSGSSVELSDDDDLEVETDTPDNRNPTDAKRARRMLSNRESARRSRRRKQAQLHELETQVAKLRDENSALLNTLTDLNAKCDGASVDNRILKANVETFRAKVTMAESTVRRLTGLMPMLQPITPTARLGMALLNNPSDSSLDLQPDFNQLFNQPVSTLTIPPVSPVQILRNNSKGK